MDYEEFKNLFESTSATAGFPIHLPNETVSIARMERCYEAHAHNVSHTCEPFHTGLRYAWRWDALLSARTDTTEEDFIREVWLDEEGRANTERPGLRLDTRLFATTGDQQTTVPSQAQLQNWFAAINSHFETIFPCDYPMPGGDVVLPIAGRTPPSVEYELSARGPVLRSLAIESFQIVLLPRQWDHPDRKDPAPDAQLDELFERIGRAFALWVDHLRLLVDPAG